MPLLRLGAEPRNIPQRSKRVGTQLWPHARRASPNSRR